MLFNRLGQINAKDPKIKRDLLSELALSYKPETATKIDNLLGDEKRLTDALNDAYRSVYANKSPEEISRMVSQAIQTLKVRSTHLGPTMQGLIERNLGRPRPGDVLIFPRGRALGQRLPHLAPDAVAFKKAA